MTIKLVGDKRLDRKFRKLSDNARGVVLVAAAAAGAKVVRDEAERLAPKRPGGGKGARGIRFERGKLTRTSVVMKIGYDKKTAWYLRFQELGTKFHAAQPHLRPALDGKRPAAMAAIGRILKLGIDAARRSS